MKIIRVKVSPKGETTVETTGFSGAACLKEADALEQSLGRIGKRVVSAEYYRREARGQKTEGYRCDS